MRAATRPALLVVAKAPEPGRVKTRLGRVVGMDRAARLAAASLHDTLAAGTRTGWSTHVSLAGDLDRAVDGESLRQALASWTVHPQRGDCLGARLADAHARVGGPVVQVGMDTPHLTESMLQDAAAGLSSYDAVLGPADDGGWWVLALREAGRAKALLGVPMSTATAGRDTRRAFEADGLAVGLTASLRDVDTVADADAVAALAPGTRFGAAWAVVREELG